MNALERFSLDGKTALVTGAARGIGKVLTGELADVAVIDMDAAGAERTASEIEGTGRRSMACEVDVTDVEAVESAIEEIIQQWGKLDIVVNNPGIATTSPSEEIPEDQWDRILDVNLKGVFFCCRAEACAMLPRGSGAIINTASMSATIVNRPQMHAHYNASKAGVVQMSKSCAAEWAGRGVRVNCLSPGHMLTPLTEELFGEIGPQLETNTPRGRIGTPDDLVGTVIFLASDASRYVTGLDLIVDGGYTLW